MDGDANLAPAPPEGAAHARAALAQALKWHGAGELERATNAYATAICLDPTLLDAHINLAVCLAASGDLAAAIARYEIALMVDPNSVRAHSNLGASLSACGRHADAGAHYERALELDPDDVAALSNYADWLNIAGRHEEALLKCRGALFLQPTHPQASCNLGTALAALGRLDEAVTAFRTALLFEPQFWKARKNLGMALLQRGDYAEGWTEYDWRFIADGIRLRPLTTPVWDGEALAGPLLICAEQGVGDEILHASLLGDLVGRGLDVVWEADPRLIDLLRRAYPTVRYLPRAMPPAPPTDAGPGLAAQYPAGSLARLLRPDAAAFPDRRGFLKPDPARRAQIAAQLGLNGEKLIGISWRSSALEIAAAKSTDFADWAPLLSAPSKSQERVRFVSLQYGADDSGLALPGLDATNDLDGLAALISLCDAVITVSNTTAHLAGALGIPAWVLVGTGRAPRWYWGTGDRTPWYPSLRFIRRAPGEPWSVALRTAAATVLNMEA